MTSLFFWKNWNRAYRITYLLSAGLFLLSLLVFITAWWRGLANVVHWDVLSELIELPAPLHAFTDGMLDYAAEGKAYAVTEQFVASAMQVHPWMATVLMLGMGVAFALIMSSISQLSRIYYLVAMTFFIGALSMFRWEMMGMPSFNGRSLFIGLAFVFGLTSYYFHAFRPDISFPRRLTIFLMLIALVVFGIGFLAEVTLPAMTVVSYGMPVLLVLSVGFIFVISFEIVAGMVWLTSAGRTNARGVAGRPLGFGNFIFISLLYLVNLLLVWLKNTKAIDWELLAISPFVLYLVSVVLGIWGFRRLNEQQEQLPFQDAGAYLYTGLALLTTLTMSYAFATANDPLVEMFEDAIVYSHLVMGVLFVGYILLNFLPLYRQGLPVYRVMYKPQRIELSLVRLAGVIAIAALLSTEGFFPFRQGITGYYNGLGDLYTATGETTSAGTYYQLALKQEFQNHKSNYALASLALAQDEKTTAAYYFQQALLKQPSPEAYAGLSHVYFQNNLFFEAVKHLQQGIRTFPKSGELQNNLGYLYARTSVADSAYYFLQSATGNTPRSEIPEANLLALWARNPRVLSADSLLSELKDHTYESYQANALALRLIAGTDTTQPERPAWLETDKKKDGLSVGRFASIYNYTLKATRPDTTTTNLLRRLSQEPVNQDFTDDLLLARAVAEYRSHHHPVALDLMGQLAQGDARNGSFYRTLSGLWLMEQGLYQRAAEHFELNPDTLSAYYRALALTKAGDVVAARSLWEIASTNDAGVASLKQALYDIKRPETDLEKAFYVAYRPDAADRESTLATIQDATLRTIAGSAIVTDYLQRDLRSAAEQLFRQLPPENQLRPFAASLRTITALRLAVARGDVNTALTLANRPVIPRHLAEQAFLKAQTYERNRQTAQARQAYGQALNLAPLDAPAVAAMARLMQQQRQSKQGYQLVLNALPYNEDHPALLKTYIMLCLDLSLPDYAEDALMRLQGATSPTDYQTFLSAYQDKLTLLEKERQKFLQ
ncbi:hypothetical protein GCM10023189_02270 [Nibrella saemangeumensis]|uniref:Tetratricopeptide repeat-containing protein n=1 Tax=Nibrella saemangeumensis TaxID=1084526 RepID=A0ABP8MCX0_9BACT